MKSVALHNLGCKVNAYEIDVMQQMLQESGYKIVPFDELADIYIVNTCSVTNIADRKSRQMLHKARKLNPEALIIATGCYVQTGQDTSALEESVDIAIGNNRKKDIVAIIEAYQNECPEEDTIIDINQTDEYEEMQLTKTAEHTRAYIKIQDGCNQFCTYCIIPYARGRVRSRSVSHILKEVEGLVANGYQEIVLTGIHISSYGVDWEGPDNLLTLITKLHAIEGLRRIRIGSLEPRIITTEFVQALHLLPKVCPHFHLSLQSGCDATLQRMNRHYTTQEYRNCVAILRRFYEHPAITTDVIVGFPGESEEEFEHTEQFLREIDYYEMHIFKYSKRQGTPAATMPLQVDSALQTRRSSRLQALALEQSKRFRTYYLNQPEEVLFEESKQIDGKTYWIGHTVHYVKVGVQTEENLENCIRTVVPTELFSDNILLSIEFSK